MSGSGISKRDILTVALLLTTVGSTVYAAAAAPNYNSFYPSLKKLQVSLTSVQYNSTDLSLDGIAAFVVQNPSAYKGMSLLALQGWMTIRLNNTVEIRQGQLQAVPATPMGSLDPGTAKMVRDTFQGSLDAPRQVTATRDHGGVVQFVFNIELALATLLDKVGYVTVGYQCVSQAGQTSCEQIDIIVLPRVQLPGGGGGGNG